METYDLPGVRLRLKVGLLKVEVIKTPPHRGVTWSRNKPDHDRLQRVHYSMLLRCPALPSWKSDDHALSYANWLAAIASERIEKIERERRVESWHEWGKSVCTEGDIRRAC